jgi:hypothetical protein
LHAVQPRLDGKMSGLDERQTAFLQSVAKELCGASEPWVEESAHLFGSTEPAPVADRNRLGNVLTCMHGGFDLRTAEGVRLAGHVPALSMIHELDCMLAASQQRCVASLALRLSPELRHRKAVAEVAWCAKMWRKNARRMMQRGCVCTRNDRGAGRYDLAGAQETGDLVCDTAETKDPGGDLLCDGKKPRVLEGVKGCLSSGMEAVEVPTS